MQTLDRIKTVFETSIQLKTTLLADEQLLNTIEEVANATIAALKEDRKVWFCGNGGSAADAQHLAAELSGRYYLDRYPLFAEALSVNTSYLTATANDYGYEQVFARLIQAKGRKGDLLFALSTSGNSENVAKACEVAQQQGLIVVGFTGKAGGKVAEHCDHLLAIPSTDTPRIQECHMLIGHLICELVEAGMFFN